MRLKFYFIILIIVIFASGCQRFNHPIKYDGDGHTIGSGSIIGDAIGGEESKEASKREIGEIAQFPTGCSVELINNQPDKSYHKLEQMGGVNLNEWTQFFVDEWGRALKDRGVAVSNNSTNKIYAKLDDFHMDPWGCPFCVNSTISVHLESDDGWQKQFKVETSRYNMDHSATVYQAIIDLMKNEEMIERMKIKLSAEELIERRKKYTEIKMKQAEKLKKAIGDRRVNPNKKVYSPNEEIIIAFLNFPGNEHDWISIATLGSKEDENYGYSYTGEDIKNGTIKLEGPFEVGKYEIRYYYNWKNGTYDYYALGNLTVAD